MHLDQQQAMRIALALGPGHCPPDLFTGSVASIVHGLKAHANCIAHAGHIALEETFPRTRALMGVEAFHAVADIHLADPHTRRLPLARIGQDYAARLPGAERDLALAEFAWLEAHGAPNSASFDLTSLAGLDVAAITSTRVTLHPASRLVELIRPDLFVWDDFTLKGTVLLIVRPHTEIILKGVDEAVSSMFQLLDRPRLLGDLLEIDQTAATVLVGIGALAIVPEFAL